jgi:hypothetical protein
LIVASDSPFIDLIINDQIQIEINLSTSLNPENFKESPSAASKINSLLEDKSLFIVTSKSTVKDLGIYKE